MGKLILLSGAGLSADSGIPTFRDGNGLWQNFDVNVVANFDTWEKNRDVVYEFYNQRRIELGKVKPNPAHWSLAKLQQELGDRFIHYTQNIDDLAERAGNTNVIHIHGYLKHMGCLTCSHSWDVGYAAVPIDTSCPECGSSKVKPGVVMFNEGAPNYKRMLETFRNVTSRDIVVVLGTSGQVVQLEWILGKNINLPFKMLVSLEASSNQLSLYNECILGKTASKSMPLLAEQFITRLK
jgi:NAD-dependent deacetylase